MRDDYQDPSLTDSASQKAVTDWLMQVISGKKPDDLSMSNGSDQPAPGASAAPSAVALEDRFAAPVVSITDVFSNGSFPKPVRAQAPDVFGDVFGMGEPPKSVAPPEPAMPVVAEPPAAAAFTVDDFFGPPMIPFTPEMVAPAPTNGSATEFTAEDLCGAPLFEIKPESNGFHHAAEPERGISVEDIFGAEAPTNGFHKAETAENGFHTGDVPENSPSEPAPGDVFGENGFSRDHVFSKDAWAHRNIWGQTPMEITAGGEEILTGPVFEEPGTEDVLESGETDLTEYSPEKFFTEENGVYPSFEELKKMVKEHPESVGATWKTLLRFGSVLPWLSKAVPLFEAGSRKEQSTGVVQEVRHEMADLRVVQVEIRTQVQEHSVQLKRMDEQLTRIRTTLDRREGDDLAQTVKATATWLKVGGIGVGVILLGLIVMVALMMAHR